MGGFGLIVVDWQWRRNALWSADRKEIFLTSANQVNISAVYMSFPVDKTLKVGLGRWIADHYKFTRIPDISRRRKTALFLTSCCHFSEMLAVKITRLNLVPYLQVDLLFCVT